VATKKSRKQSVIKPGETAQAAMERRIAHCIKLRREQVGISANDLAERSGVSRAMVSKIERSEVSPTAALLGRLCNGLGITLSSLIASAEQGESPPITRADTQPVWRDPETGLLRTMVSPMNIGSRTEIVQVELPAGAEVKYEALRVPSEQHVLVLSGRLTMSFAADEFELGSGDCIRSRLDVPHAFANGGRGACKYLVVIAR
jgi:transcriptional regulator with XRE-family HTH domain